MTKPSDLQTAARKLRDFARDMQHMADVFDEKVENIQTILGRLDFIFSGDADLAKIVYNYVMRGHLAHHNYLRERFKPCQKS